MHTRSIAHFFTLALIACSTLLCTGCLDWHSKRDNPMDPNAANWSKPAIDSLKVLGSGDTLQLRVYAHDAKEPITRIDYSTNGTTWNNANSDTLLRLPLNPSGIWSLWLRTTNSNGVVSDSVLSHNSAPIVTGTTSAASALVTDTITFSGFISDPDSNEVDSLWWDLDGDGTFEIAAARMVQQKFVFADSAGGVKTVHVKAKDSDGAWGTATLSVAVTPNRAPVLSALQPSSTIPTITQTITIPAPTLSDPDHNQIDSLYWDLNSDGIFETATGLGVTMRDSFPNPTGGNYLVKVYAKDRAGASDTASLNFLVPANRAPVLSAITRSPNRTTAGLNDIFAFSVASNALTDADGNLVDSLWWDLDGSGTFATKKARIDTVYYKSSTATTATIAAKGRDKVGLWSATANVVLTVINDPPTITLTDSTAGVIGQSIALHATLGPGVYGGSITRVEWSLGGGTWQSAATTGDTTITLPNTPQDAYWVKIRATDDDGQATLDSEKIWVRNGVIDTRDGQAYPAVTIGSQVWMATNLNYLPTSGNSWCYGTSASNCAIYGRLYDYTTALTVCPTGWHLPDTTAWNTLEAYVGGTATAGTALKANSTLWNTNTGTDAYGFSALPAGVCYGGSFNYVGNYGYWWTATAYGSSDAYSRGMSYSYAGVAHGDYGQTDGFSARCLKDSP